MKDDHECSNQYLMIRDFRIEDYDEVISLWRSCGLPFRPNGRDSIARIAKEIEKPMALFLVATYQHEIVGTLFGTTDGRKGWINRLAVKPNHQRRGFAKRLIIEMETRFEARGLEVFSCLIENHSDSSIRLFEAMGYEEDPKVHYFSKRLDKDS
jgi:ribosomal protein S18 acetylase RimI-like enzyme